MRDDQNEAVQFEVRRIDREAMPPIQRAARDRLWDYLLSPPKSDAEMEEGQNQS